MSKEVEEDKERLLKEKDSKIELLKITQVKTEEKKNELYKEKNKEEPKGEFAKVICISFESD